MPRCRGQTRESNVSSMLISVRHVKLPVQAGSLEVCCELPMRCEATRVLRFPADTQIRWHIYLLWSDSTKDEVSGKVISDCTISRVRDTVAVCLPSYFACIPGKYSYSGPSSLLELEAVVARLTHTHNPTLALL